MDKTIKKLFFIQLGLVLLFPVLILIRVYFPFWGIIPALAIVSMIWVIKKLEKGLLKTSLMINNLSILLFPFFLTIIILLAFPPGFIGSFGKQNCPVSPDLVLKASGVIAVAIGLIIIPITYLVTTGIITVLFVKDSRGKGEKKRK
jgi:hypothetical protein